MKASGRQGSAGRGATRKPVVLSESLLATGDEMGATSKSLYGDHKARISSNVGHIHDRLRIQAYTSAVQGCMKGKNILHLGCGMGLISMLAARNNAKHVVAIDTSEIVKPAAKVAEENKVNNITFLQTKLSEIAAEDKSKMPCEKFDVIMCEWMGSFLTNEPMLKELIYASEHYLIEGGIVCPDQTSLHVVAITDYQYHHDSCNYWDNVYGFKMSAMKPLVMNEAGTCGIPKASIATNASCLTSLNFSNLAKAFLAAGTDKAKQDEALSYSAPFSIKVTQRCTIHFLTFFMDCVFSNPAGSFAMGVNPGSGNNLNTEVSVPLGEFLPVNIGDVITGTVSVRPSPKSGTTLIDVKCSMQNEMASIETGGSYNYTF